jgi:hypothetical protein
MTGCGKAAPPKVASGTKVFDAVSPEIKAEWDKTLAAAAANDYATAITTCRKLQARGDLNDAQRAAVIDTMTAVNSKMSDAAQKGDPNARKAIEELRKSWRTR